MNARKEFSFWLFWINDFKQFSSNCIFPKFNLKSNNMKNDLLTCAILWYHAISITLIVIIIFNHKWWTFTRHTRIIINQELFAFGVSLQTPIYEYKILLSNFDENRISIQILCFPSFEMKGKLFFSGIGLLYTAFRRYKFYKIEIHWANLNNTWKTTTWVMTKQ